MPYIPQADRPRFDKEIAGLVDKLCFNDDGGKKDLVPGDFNYIVSSILAGILEVKGTSYTLVNTLDGALGCISKEFYRRKAVPYEDKKIQENGDVY